MMDKTAIKKAFAKAAESYDRYAWVQRLTAEKLIQKITTNNIGSILEVGCGTGNYTQLLRNKFPQAKIIAIDISEEMLALAKEKVNSRSVEFISADAEEIDFKDNFSLITSNATFQWFCNLKDTLIKYRAMLKKRGKIYFSIFGPATFKEIKDCLNLAHKKIKIPAENFISRSRLEKKLKEIFNRVAVEERIIIKCYSSLRELLRYIKHTSPINNNSRIWTPDTLMQLERIYKKNFSSIKATYQIFFCQAQ